MLTMIHMYNGVLFPTKLNERGVKRKARKARNPSHISIQWNIPQRIVEKSI